MATEEEMVADGSLELAGISENGEVLYCFTDKCKELHPEVWNRQFTNFQAGVRYLWEKGYLEVEFTDDDVLISLTDKSFQPGDDLDEDMVQLLNEVLDALSQLVQE